MIDYMTILRTRRSIREFKDTDVTEKQIKLLKESLVRAPTSRGRNPWQFILIDEPALLDEVSRAKMHGSAFIAEAKLAFVMCVD